MSLRNSRGTGMALRRLSVVLALALAACSGPSGSDGRDGAVGPTGPSGPPGQNGVSTGGVMGRVTYVDGGVEHPAANVDVTSIPQCGEATKTDADGNYELGSGCPIGVYTIVFSGTGFRTLTVPNISITAGREYILNVQLQTGTGPVVPPGEGVAAVEQCASCHMLGAFGSGTFVERHAVADADAVQVAIVTPPAVAANGTDITFSFNVKVNGVNADDFTQKLSAAVNHNEDAWRYYDAATNAGVRTKFTKIDAVDGGGSAGCTAAPGAWVACSWAFTRVGSGTGEYKVTLYGLALNANAQQGGASFMVGVARADKVGATAVAYWPGTDPHDVVSNEACKNCHGNHVWRGAIHDATNAQGRDPCLFCHNNGGGQTETRLTGYMNVENPWHLPAQAAVAGTAGTGLMGIVHGVHNSRNMPDQTYTWVWSQNGNTANFSKGFPGNMNNCRTCHDSEARLAKVMAAPVSYTLCVSCHDTAAFGRAPKTGTLMNHTTFTPSTSCALCHGGQTVAEFHNGQVTERAGLIWDGADQSVLLAPTTVLDITGVSVSGTNLVVTWTATNSVTSAALNPCNTDFAQGPVFFGYKSSLDRTEGCTNTPAPAGCNSSFSLLRAYAQANDWVNEGTTGVTSPGQPKSTNITATNTTCASNVATTTVPLTAFDTGFTMPTKGIVALQGKAQVTWQPNGNIIFVRTQSPTREFMTADGSLPAAADQRRVLVDVNKCNACHLGTLYQHGGTRVDKIELCVMCHNPASSEQNNRVGMGVTAAEAYDGKPGETYDMRYMVHAIHSAGAEYGPSPGYALPDANGTRLQLQGPLIKAGKQLMFYRGNGIFYFGSKETLETISTWPLNAGSGGECVSCVDVEDGPLTICKVYGSAATGDAPPTANADGSCNYPKDPLDPTKNAPSTNGTWRSHRVVEVEYPRALNDCSACHVDGAVDSFPDPTKAVGVTYDTGDAPYNVGVNDMLIGPSAASCMSCHRSADPAVEAGLQDHAAFGGFAPSVFPNGRQTLIDAAQ
jgi:OmcA/MtrC family decaheme c-type cytochrome